VGLRGASLGRVLQIGAGGAGAATAHALLALGVGTLLVCDRDQQRARQLVEQLQRDQGAQCATRVDGAVAALPGADGVVNATPMGMATHPQSPIDTRLLDPRQWVADIVYFPLETELLRAARARGCRTLDGSGMAVYQAAAAFEIFTGRRRPRSAAVISSAWRDSR
jgi:shikimate dehydrogenase